MYNNTAPKQVKEKTFYQHTYRLFFRQLPLKKRKLLLSFLPKKFSKLNQQYFYFLNLVGCILINSLFISSASAEKSHGVSTFTNLKYSRNFTHYDYTNPNAPKGGRITLGESGSFNSLNPFIIKGIPPAGITLTYAHLLNEAKDAPGEFYAYVAESLEVAPDRSSVTFYLDTTAKFSDGTPITADDVIWSFETLRNEGLPLYRTYYKNINKAEKIDDHTVKFSFNTNKNRELPGIIGQLPILPKKFYETHSFNSTDMIPPPTSGPYIIDKIYPDKSITYRRNINWWGQSIPSQKGQHNFDVIHYDYYLDSTTQFEAFKIGKIDARLENSSKNWITAYDFPGIKNGFVNKVEIPTKLTSPTYGFFFNTRRAPFQNPLVRQALTLCFNFEWVNKKLFYGFYKRNHSYYPNSNFAAEGKPSSQEAEILKTFMHAEKNEKEVPLKALTDEFILPKASTETAFRSYLIQATDLLKQAGWTLDNGVLKNTKNNQPFELEIIIGNRNLEKIVLHFKECLERIGIKLKIRLLDITTYQYRVDHLDYDMILSVIPQSSSLGNEQRDYFGSEKADIQGTFNYAGIKNKVVDALIEKLIRSETYEELCLNARILDRVLLWNFYMVPAWHKETAQIAYWDKFGVPAVSAAYNPFDITTWWYDTEKTAKLEKKQINNPEPFIKRGWEKIKSFFG